MIDVQGDNIMEQAVLQLIQDGTVKRHVRKATNYYKAKRDFTTKLLNKHLKEKISFAIPEGGLAFWLVPNKEILWNDMFQNLENKGIKISMPDTYSSKDTVNGIRFGFGSLSEEELENAIIALAKML